MQFQFVTDWLDFAIAQIRGIYADVRNLYIPIEVLDFYEN